MFYLLTFIIAFAISLISVPILIKLAKKYHIYDIPSTDVKTHKEPTPYLGGLAIAVSFFITLIIIRFTTNFDTGTLYNLRGIFLAGTLIVIIGAIDDLKDMNFKLKFVWQFLAATILIFFDMKIKFITPNYMSIALTYIWIIGLMNAVNLIDIMDGLSSGIAIIACMAFFFINSPLEASYVNFAAIALAGACLGFIKYNFNPARIFMGDAGSMFIGLILAAVSLGANYSTKNPIGVLTPIVILAIPIYDTIYIIIKRLEKGKSIFLGSKDHVALRLNIHGFSIKKTVIYLYIAGFCNAIVSFFITESSLKTAIYLYIITIIIGFMIGIRLGKIEVD